MPTNMARIPDGALRWLERAHCTDFPMKPLNDASTNPAVPYEDYDGSGFYEGRALNASEVPICDDLLIDIEHIKPNVRLSDALIFKMWITEHDVPREVWHLFWPYDFLPGGVIRLDRRPTGKGPVVMAAGIGFYPFFGGYLALCGEMAGRYTAQLGHYEHGARLPYQGFRVGQLVAMEEDLTDNDRIFQLEDLRGTPIEFTHSHTDLVGQFKDGMFILAPLSSFINFCPYVSKDLTIEWPGSELCGLTLAEWNELIEKGRGLQSSTTAPDAGSADAPASASAEPQVSVSAFLRSAPLPQPEGCLYKPVPNEILLCKIDMLTLLVIGRVIEDSHQATKDTTRDLRSNRKQILLLHHQMRHLPGGRTAERAARRSIDKMITRYKADRLRLLSMIESLADPIIRHIFELAMMLAGVCADPLNVDRFFNLIESTGRI